jgi:hypothetical protein
MTMEGARELDRIYRRAFDTERSEFAHNNYGKSKMTHERSVKRRTGKHHLEHRKVEKQSPDVRVLQVSVGGEQDFVFNSSSPNADAETHHDVALELRTRREKQEVIRVAPARERLVLFRRLPLDCDHDIDVVNSRCAAGAGFLLEGADGDADVDDDDDFVGAGDDDDVDDKVARQ